MPSLLHRQRAIFVVLAVLMVGSTLLWHLPLMLWDHLDLAPIYQVWQEGGLSISGIWHHGNHLHASAYGALLVTTELSGGQPWLDSMLSFVLLLGYVLLVMRMVRSAWPAEANLWLWFGMVFLALYPGHLTNLQWGWQVGVFLALFGVALCIHGLSTGALVWWRNAYALAGAALACTSFATGPALLPAALVIISMRRELPTGRRVLHAAPWLLLAGLVAMEYTKLVGAGHGMSQEAGLLVLARYSFNYIGGGVLRTATDLAGWLALIAVLAAAHMIWVGRRRRESLPWVGMLVFGLGSAALTAVGRAALFGPDHAFATRYVSFSSVFWLGWVGLFVVVRPALGGAGRWLSALAATLVGLAVANGLHVAKKAARNSVRAHEVAAIIRQDFPAVDPAVLDEIYYPGQADAARRHLKVLRSYGFAPFGKMPSVGGVGAGSGQEDAGRAQ